ERQRLGHDAASAVPDQERERDRPQRLDPRVERGLPPGRTKERPAILGVEPAESFALVALAHEELHDGHALERLLQKSVETRQAPTDLTVGVTRVQAEVDAHDQ